MEISSQIAVLTNVCILFKDFRRKNIVFILQALLIAFTSEFIPKIVYKLYYSSHNDLEGYVKHSLLGFNTYEYQQYWGDHRESDPEICYYNGYRKPYYTIQSFGQNIDHWHILFARLAFIIIFEHLVFLLKGFTKYIIPDLPGPLKVQLEYEQLAASHNFVPGNDQNEEDGEE
jgi:hypothetical protein